MDHNTSRNAAYLDEVMRTFCTGIGFLSEMAGPYGEQKGGDPARSVQAHHLLASARLMKPLTSQQRHKIRKVALTLWQPLEPVPAFARNLLSPSVPLLRGM